MFGRSVTWVTRWLAPLAPEASVGTVPGQFGPNPEAASVFVVDRRQSEARLLDVHLFLKVTKFHSDQFVRTAQPAASPEWTLEELQLVLNC